MIATLIAWPTLKRALGRRRPAALTQIDRNRAAKRAGDALEAGFGDVMAVDAVERLDMQREPGFSGEGPEQPAPQGDEETADPLGREFALKDEERPARHVERDPRQRFVHRQQAVGVAGQAALVAERLGKRLAQGDADVLNRVVIVDMAVAPPPGPGGDEGGAGT